MNSWLRVETGRAAKEFLTKQTMHPIHHPKRSFALWFTVSALFTVLAQVAASPDLRGGRPLRRPHVTLDAGCK